MLQLLSQEDIKELIPILGHRVKLIAGIKQLKQIIDKAFPTEEQEEPRSNNILHQFPLHRISYCADDKGAKKYFSFIAKGSIANGAGGGEDEKHQCFVFISTKLASEITLTIGQAFDLAYRRFLNDNGKYIEMQKLSLQNKRLELQLLTYKNRLQELSKITYKEDLTSYLAKNKLTEITEWKAPAELEKQIASLTVSNGFASQNGGANVGDSGMELSNHSLSETASQSNDSNLLLTTPPPAYNGKPTFNNKHVELMGDSPSKNPVVGTKLEGLLLNSDSDSGKIYLSLPVSLHQTDSPSNGYKFLY
ncbi:PTB domain-containing adapter protein ced-6 [Eumeta japonica]|uniref:PTB domain-containing adapter protein ced-6 n=1 Tax=Eumeta variegata TaxID=151549 RepID=A0A4C1TNQ2_EUMVA|nr:PTB domain-containing adapter protein ced-6 [Eumeta japonica]